MDLIILLIFVVVFLASYLFLSRPKGLPPGPIVFPFIGSYPFLKQLKGRLPHIVYLEAAKKYGNIFSFKVGQERFVVLTGYEAINQALVKQADVFSDRPNWIEFLKDFYKDGIGIVMRSYDLKWRTVRRFTLQTLRDFGVGKSSLEEKIMTEVEAATKYLVDTNGEPTEMASLSQMMIRNVIYGIIFGHRGQWPGFHLCSNVFPSWFTKIFIREAHDNKLKREASMNKLAEFMNGIAKEHEETFDENHIRDFVDLYVQIKRTGKLDDKEVFTIGNMRRVIHDLFFAGSETTSTALDWAFLLMAEYPDVQENCQQEIQKVFGHQKITYANRGKLKYVEATIMEIQRLTSIVPLSVAHANLVDTELLGYKIPKKTFVIPNLYSIHMDPNLWEEPTKFNPDRFLDGNGKIVKKDACMPFSIGPRTCLGEPLARMELFLVFANLLQRFSFEREDPNVKHSLQPRLNQITNSPLPYKIRVKQR